MVVGIADEAQSTFIRGSTARKILHVVRESVERLPRVVDVVIPVSEHLSIGEVRSSNIPPVLIVDNAARLLWKIVPQLLEFPEALVANCCMALKVVTIFLR
jgi:hypothetical protein